MLGEAKVGSDRGRDRKPSQLLGDLRVESQVMCPNFLSKEEQSVAEEVESMDNGPKRRKAS